MERVCLLTSFSTQVHQIVNFVCHFVAEAGSGKKVAKRVKTMAVAPDELAFTCNSKSIGETACRIVH